MKRLFEWLERMMICVAFDQANDHIHTLVDPKELEKAKAITTSKEG